MLSVLLPGGQHSKESTYVEHVVSKTTKHARMIERVAGYVAEVCKTGKDAHFLGHVASFLHLH